MTDDSSAEHTQVELMSWTKWAPGKRQKPKRSLLGQIAMDIVGPQAFDAWIHRMVMGMIDRAHGQPLRLRAERR